MTWRQEVFGPMRARTLESAQMHHLVTHYDLAPDSRLGGAIIRKVNQTLADDERRRGVRRVQPGELVLWTSRGSLLLPLRTNEDLDRVLAGERWDRIRRDILERCETLYRQSHPRARAGDIARFLLSLWQGPVPRRVRSEPSLLYGPRRNRPWGHAPGGTRPLDGLDAARLASLKAPPQPQPRYRQEALEELLHYLGTEAGIPPAVQEPLLFELIAIRARFCPHPSLLATGQMPLAAMHVQAGRTLWQPSRLQPLAPVIVSPLLPGEIRHLRRQPPQTYEDYLGLHGQRLARVLTEAYMQNGLLSFAELQWLSLLSTATVSRAIDFYQRRHQVILPCPGTVLDMGRMLTHKDLIVRLHLQGYSVLEIARKTLHNPRSVDAYLKVFDSVLILHLYGLPVELMAGVLGRGQYLVGEYLEIIQHRLKDAAVMRDYLRARGLKVPTQISLNG